MNFLPFAFFQKGSYRPVSGAIYQRLSSCHGVENMEVLLIGFVLVVLMVLAQHFLGKNSWATSIQRSFVLGIFALVVYTIIYVLMQ
jgi:hypothetical protein